MIAVECRGRLGNQMFQYAFAVAAARLLETSASFDAAELRPLFVLGDETVVAGAPAPAESVAIENDSFDEPEEVLEQLRDGVTYSGFFQSERFFAHAVADVRSAFELRPEHVDAFQARFADLLSAGYVCCHLRRTDYHEFAGGAALPMSYYRNALRRLAVSDETPVVFVGDDVEEAQAAFGTMPRARFERNDEALDLQLVMHADAVVVSNSTFGWWGAWLNERPHKRVLAPRYWLGYRFGWEYPPRVIPADWTRVPVPRPLRARLSPSYLRMSVGRGRRRSRDA